MTVRHLAPMYAEMSLRLPLIFPVARDAITCRCALRRSWHRRPTALRAMQWNWSRSRLSPTWPARQSSGSHRARPAICCADAELGCGNVFRKALRERPYAYRNRKPTIDAAWRLRERFAPEGRRAVLSWEPITLPNGGILTNALMWHGVSA